MASEQQVAAVQHAANSAEMAIAFVVESSLTVAGVWTRIITEYVSPMLRRLYESNPTAKARIVSTSSHINLAKTASLAPFGVHHVRDGRHQAFSTPIQAILSRLPARHKGNEGVAYLSGHRHNQLRWESRDGRARGPGCGNRGLSHCFHAFSTVRSFQAAL